MLYTHILHVPLSKIFNPEAEEAHRERDVEAESPPSQWTSRAGVELVDRSLARLNVTAAAKDCDKDKNIKEHIIFFWLIFMVHMSLGSMFFINVCHLRM